MRAKIKKFSSLLLALMLVIGVFTAVPFTTSAADDVVDSQTAVDEYGRYRGIPIPDGMIVNSVPEFDPDNTDWDGYYKIYYFEAPDSWLENAQYKNEDYEIGFYWYQGETCNGVWPGEPANSLADFKVDYFKMMNPSATKGEIASATAEIEAQFGNVYYAVCRTNVPFIIWNNGINGGLPTDPDFDLNRANAAKRTQDIYVEDPSYNSLGTTAEGAGDGYGVTDLCGCIAYVTGETTVENPLTGISETIYTVNWKFYDPKSGASTTTGLLDENGNLITYDVYGFGEAENPYYDLDYTFVPEIEFPEEKTTEPETDPIDPDSPQPSFGKPSFSGGTIYWECPWEVAQIAYCHVFGHEGSSLYDWQTKNEKMTREGGNLWSYEIPAGPYDLVIFSIDTGAQTYNLVLTDDCISKTAVSDTDTMIENPMDSNKVACRTTWKGVGPVVAGPHLAITSIGNIVGETLCPTESGAEMVAYFIYNFLPVNPDCVTAEVLNVAISKAGTTGEEVLAVLTTMRDFTMLDEAKELLGVGGGSDSEGYYYIVLDDDTIEITDYAGGDTELVIPCEIEGKLVTSIGERAFYDFSRIISITIPDSVTYIGNCAFGYYSVIHPPVYDPETGTSSKGYIEVVKIDGFTVYGYTGTAAEQYAKDNGFEFIALEPEVITGDASGDGVVDAKDRMLLSRYLAKWKGYENIDVKAADVNNDGEVNAKDRMILARHLAKWKGYETLPLDK